MKKFFLIIALIYFPSILKAQKMGGSEVELFPSGLSIHPFEANLLEPKLGFTFRTNSNQLWLNIGNSFDILKIKNDGDTYTIGADLFTWTLLNREENFHFPVIAVDYLFGINLGYITKAHNYSMGGRLRVSHISAHFVDGHFDGSLRQWKEGMNPRVYSREFVELLGFYSYSGLRIHAGGTYLFHVDPSTIGKGILQTGIEYYQKDLFAENLSPFAAAETVIKAKESYTNFSFNFGLKFGKIDGRGLKLYYEYYNGYDINGEYFDIKREYSSVGINLDL